MHNNLSQSVQILQNYIFLARLATHFGLEVSVVYEELVHFEPKSPDKTHKDFWSFITSSSLIFCTKLF